MGRFVKDMENVKYVNSTGLGYLINPADSVTPGKGGISLVKLQPKAKVVFDMPGLNAFFRIFPRPHGTTGSISYDRGLGSFDPRAAYERSRS